MSETGTRRTPLATNWTKNFNMENVSNRLNINSEKDSQDLLLRNIRALPEREPLPPSTMASSSTQLPLMSRTERLRIMQYDKKQRLDCKDSTSCHVWCFVKAMISLYQPFYDFQLGSAVLRFFLSIIFYCLFFSTLILFIAAVTTQSVGWAHLRLTFPPQWNLGLGALTSSRLPPRRTPLPDPLAQAATKD
ncbi:unnamed protein product [Fusarium graminearum]|nr:unnamed protein product [Fusarium graminearum]CAG2002692.1 unnamed protein product [Fusarium graminearum]VTO92109.1 unnamed protein product [Fusarium graminearum]